ncbi:MAG: hypothetical protein AUK34_08310 [Ignavibacteria bacterium CG2_30_36_16]|nr:MAG: hypothetical protein AUK34_08310 [Ignavibacteria bacterium CG2_30_36_16]PJB00865.1 MAG: hypothetical protein CO127_06820 [Ignavibacteria bacterium CG_4_9_14_3_um_filter_36_18]
MVGIATNWIMFKKNNPKESNLKILAGFSRELKFKEDEFEKTNAGNDELSPKTNPAVSNRCAAAEALWLFRTEAITMIDAICTTSA